MKILLYNEKGLLAKVTNPSRMVILVDPTGESIGHFVIEQKGGDLTIKGKGGTSALTINTESKIYLIGDFGKGILSE